jgi:hypothetical protein
MCRGRPLGQWAKWRVDIFSREGRKVVRLRLYPSPFSLLISQFLKVTAQFLLGDGIAMDFVGTVGEAQGA